MGSVSCLEMTACISFLLCRGMKHHQWETDRIIWRYLNTKSGCRSSGMKGLVTVQLLPQQWCQWPPAWLQLWLQSHANARPIARQVFRVGLKCFWQALGNIISHWIYLHKLQDLFLLCHFATKLFSVPSATGHFLLSFAPGHVTLKPVAWYPAFSHRTCSKGR